ncbi:hypothetical protein GCM10022247_45150 [Allokutzneria multivorans]|uniref:Uncharacterized protein n=1 Tax=Allokutzneria multivorans TaxID=1142134 RepID=A0ABP7SUV0_9PSEU
MAFDLLLVATAVAVGVALPSVLITELRSCPKDCPCLDDQPQTRPVKTALSATKEGRSVNCISPGSVPTE